MVRASPTTCQLPHDLATRALNGADDSCPLRARDVGPEVRDALVAETLADAAERRAVWIT